jgi:hypothetical protein
LRVPLLGLLGIAGSAEQLFVAMAPTLPSAASRESSEAVGNVAGTSVPTGSSTGFVSWFSTLPPHAVKAPASTKDSPITLPGMLPRII